MTMGKVYSRSKLFWAGCALPLGMILFNLIGFFYLVFPAD